MNHISYNRETLRRSLYNLLRQYFLWLTTYIINVSCNFSNIPFITQRITQIVEDIAVIINYYYGYQNSKIFELLLKNHFFISAKYVNEIHNGNIDAANEDKIELYNNSNDIANYFSGLNTYWTDQEWQNILYSHINMLEEHFGCKYYTQSEVITGINNEVENEANRIADYMAQGIIQQFNL